MKKYDDSIKEKLGDSILMPTNKQRNQPREWIPYEDDEVDPIQIPENNVCHDD